MAPQSRGGGRPSTFQTQSSPNILTARSLVTERRQTHLEPDPEPASTSASEEPSPEPEPFSDYSDSASSEGDEEEGANSTNDVPSKRPKELFPTRSFSHLPPSSSQLFPPFYNRPPTPLPPSPSLTSLLRPSFSTQTSHHTTPESSDAESVPGGSTLLANAAKSASTTAAAPRVSPKVPTYEYYGFALYLASSGFFLMYLLWAYLPSPFLHQLGIYYYPNRWWALAIPAWLVVLLVYIYVALASFNTGHLTLPMTSSENIVDEAAQIAIVDREGKIVRRTKTSRFEAKKSGGRGKHSRQNSQQGVGVGRGYVPANLGRDVQWKSMWNEGTDAVMDVPIGGVCEILYGEPRMD